MMSKSIFVSFPLNNAETLVEVSYNIEMNDDIQTIQCIVNPGSNNILQWLQLRKFELKSHFENGYYTPLYSDNGNIKNINAALFLDKAFEEIMGKEKMKMALVN